MLWSAEDGSESKDSEPENIQNILILALCLYRKFDDQGQNLMKLS